MSVLRYVVHAMNVLARGTVTGCKAVYTVRIWKIRLIGRKTRSNQPRITSWKLSVGTGSEENETLTDIHTNNTTLQPYMQEFEIDSPRAFKIYRLYVLSADTGDIGLSYFQIYRKRNFG